MRRLAPVALFAVAMAYLEAAVVVYLRRLVGVVEPWRDPSVYDPTVAGIELGREAATLLMLLTVGWACGRNAQSRAGFALFAFGVWDIFYYLWLRILIGWPASLLTPDILFLIPLPWWGPVLTPVLIAILLAGAGVAAIALDDRGRAVRVRRIDAALLAAGIVLILIAFMGDALAALPASAEQLSQVRPAGFRWRTYVAGLLLLGLGIVRPVAARSGRAESRVDRRA